MEEIGMRLKRKMFGFPDPHADIFRKEHLNTFAEKEHVGFGGPKCCGKTTTYASARKDLNKFTEKEPVGFGPNGRIGGKTPKPLPVLFPTRIITREHMTETKYRRRTMAERRKKDRWKHTEKYEVPSQKILFGDSAIYCHPEIAKKIETIAEEKHGLI